MDVEITTVVPVQGVAEDLASGSGHKHGALILEFFMEKLTEEIFDERILIHLASHLLKGATNYGSDKVLLGKLRECIRTADSIANEFDEACNKQPLNRRNGDSFREMYQQIDV